MEQTGSGLPEVGRRSNKEKVVGRIPASNVSANLIWDFIFSGICVRQTDCIVHRDLINGSSKLLFGVSDRQLGFFFF